MTLEQMRNTLAEQAVELIGAAHAEDCDPDRRTRLIRRAEHIAEHVHALDRWLGKAEPRAG